MPTICQDLWERLGLPGQVADQRIGIDTQWGANPGGMTVIKGDPLFPRKTS
jgi:methionyl-tRNA synthetase